MKRLLARDPGTLALSVSATTRAPRPGERDGVDYGFVSDEAFDRMIAGDELLEWAPIVGHRSGTPRRFVEEQLERGRDVLLEIDVKGAFQIRERVPASLLIFLAPPSADVLERRLRGRATEDEARIDARLATAEWELSQSDRFDHVVVNDDLDAAVEEVAAIIGGSRNAPGEDAAR